MLLSLSKLYLMASLLMLRSCGGYLLKNKLLLRRGLHILNPSLSIGYWSKAEGNDADGVDQSQSSSGSGKSSSLISSFGDNSPIVSPLIILPTTRKPIFPGFLSAFQVKDKTTIDALINKNRPHNYVGVFLRQPDASPMDEKKSEIITSVDDIHKVGTFAQIVNIVQTDAGIQLLVMGHRRISLGEINAFGPPTIANVKHWAKPPMKEASVAVKAYCNEILALARDIIKIDPLLHAQLSLQEWTSRVDFRDPYRVADVAMALVDMKGEESHELQKVLEAEDIEQRLAITFDLLAKEREFLKLQNDLHKQVEDKVSKQQKEYFLREQLKTIKKELGVEKDDKEELITKYHTQLQEIESRSVNMSETTLKLIREEVKKLEFLEKASPEFNIVKSYLDWLFAVPWGLMSKDVLNLQAARHILDEDHYGLDEIKKRILEFIAVGKLQGSVAGKIICFIGPPGVGKTSIAKSIARTLDRKFYRFSVGGLTDTAEIKGHRRTYIGAMPGKPIQCLKTTGFLNPVILIDEIDKLGRSHQGDPASALLELLDPNQNSNFVDHYLDIPLDFSSVLFICTANDESAIPGPLHDRMEIIRLSGYDVREKVAIASKYLVPKAIEASGLLKNATATYTITDDALDVLIKNYCRESGVRSLEKMINKLTRKLAFQRVEQEETNVQQNAAKSTDATTAATTPTATVDTTLVSEPSITTNATISKVTNATEEVVITAKDIESYLGKAIFQDDTIYENQDAELPPGIVMGLAWSPMGGSPIFIETVGVPASFSERDSGVHMVTGQLGSVMKESTNIAYTFARKFILERDRENKYFHTHQIHLHVPEGAISKDGPSAGVAMACSFVSAALNRPLKPRLAMTGELSLTGKVLPVGGIKEKTLAAKRSGATTLILPAANKRDFDELPDYIKENLTVHFAKEYQEAFDIAFPSK